MKSTKILSILAALTLLATPALADKTLVFNLGVEPKTIDPVLNSANDGSNVIVNIFEGLVRRGPNGLEPGCAEKWEISEDGMTATFHLRDNAKWSDGKPVTSNDFKFAFTRMLTPENACPYSYLGYFIKNGEKFFKGEAKAEDLGIETPDEKTIVLHMEYRAPLLIEYLSFNPFVAAREDIVSQDNRGWTTKGALVCNGPFMVEKWEHNNEITLKKNPNYWEADKVKLDTLRFVMIQDSNTALAAYKGGKVDFMENIPPQMTPVLIKSGEAKVKVTLGTGFTVVNVTKKPFDDPRVRKAFSLAIDRKLLCEKVLQGGQQPANGFVPYGIPGVDESGKDFRSEDETQYLPENAQPEEAKKLLADAGYPNGEGIPHLVYLYNNNPGNKLIAEALQGMWQRNLGIEVELKNEEWKVFIDNRQQGNYMIARHAWLSDFNDAENMLALWTTSNWENCTKWSNEEYDKLLLDCASQMDRPTRIGNMHKAEKILMDEHPVIPMYYYTQPYMMKDYVKDVFQDNFKHNFFIYADIQK